jgi:hypothetical protein
MKALKLKSFVVGLVLANPFVSAMADSMSDALLNPFGSGPGVVQTTIAPRSAFTSIMAAGYDSAVGVSTSDLIVGGIDNSSSMKYSRIDFGNGGAQTFGAAVGVAESSAGQKIEVHIDSLSGPLVATLTVLNTGAFWNFAPQWTTATNVTGIHDVYLVGKGTTGIGNLYSFIFSTAPMPATRTTTKYMIGQHFHRAQNPINHWYLFARTHDNEAASGGKMKWWLGDDSYDFTALDAFRDQHKANGASILLTFYGSPQWASARPDEPNKHYPSWLGGLAEPKDLNSYGRMVKATVGRYQQDLYAVECWNEPFADTYNGYDPSHAEFFSGSPTALADMCKTLFLNTKAVDPRIPVICPAEAYDSPIVLGAKTSQGESILKYCDWVGWHPYGYTGIPGVGGDLGAMIDKINGYIANSGGPIRPVIITEWGVAYFQNVQSDFQNMSSAAKANVLYESLRVGGQKGLKGFAVYGYDNDLIGINGTNADVSVGISNAVNDFARK